MEFNATTELWWDGSLGALLKSWYGVEQKDKTFFKFKLKDEAD